MASQAESASDIRSDTHWQSQAASDAVSDSERTANEVQVEAHPIPLRFIRAAPLAASVLMSLHNIPHFASAHTTNLTRTCTAVHTHWPHQTWATGFTSHRKKRRSSSHKGAVGEQTPSIAEVGGGGGQCARA
eukprot:3230647-Rhodomonas_salina.2